MIRSLLLSNSTMPGTPFFRWPSPYVKDFLGKQVKEVLFIPFAAVTFTYDDYLGKVREVFGSLGYGVEGIHETGNKKAAIAKAEAIVVGGGNSFALLARMYAEDLVAVVRSKVVAGTPYIGWSAGANMACPTIMTTNDMPVVMLRSFLSLNLVPFQINPHYHELKFENQGGETRRERLEEFLLLNPEKKVIGLPEGMFVRREGNSLLAGGEGTAKLYEAGKPVKDIPAGSDISFLLG